MRKFTLFLSLFIAMTMTAVAQSAVNLTFTRADQSVAVAITDESGTAIEGATATVALSGSTSTWKSNGDLATSTNVICPDVNANTSPTIEMTVTINGLGSKKLTSLGLDIHALNGGGIHQLNGSDEPDRHWNVDVKANDASFASYTDLEIARGCVTDGVTHKMHNAANVTATEVTDPLTLKLTIGKGTNNGGCFFGLEKIVLGVEDVAVEPEEPETPAVKQYRVKELTSGKYLYVGDYNVTSGGAYGTVYLADLAESNDQIFTLEEAENNSYYLLSASGYYIKCQQWNVDANDADKTALTLNGANLDDLTATFTISWTGGYFKVEYVSAGGQTFPFCDAAESAAATWVLEEVKAAEPEAPVYTASVTMNPATLVATDATAWATVENNVATFTAEVYNDKYEFVGWTNGTETVSTDLVYTVTLTENLELVANFQEKATEPEGLKPVVSLDADVLGTMPYKLSDGDAAKVFELSTLTVAVKVTTPATMSGRQALLCTSDPTANANTDAMPTGSAYVGYGFNNADLGYLASCKEGDRYTANVGITGSTEYVVVYVLNPAGNNYKSYVNGTMHVDRNFNPYEIATPKMVKEDHANACIYIGGGMTAEGARETFAGTILGVQVYDGELTAEQIAGLFPEEPEAPVYTASVTMNPATLVATDATAWATVENNVATFTAEVYNDKYEFVGWTNGTETVSTDLVYTVTLTENLELVANFQEKATEPEAPAYDWAGEYTVNATVADETDNWTTPSPLTMKIFYDEAAAAYKLESFAGVDIKAASGTYGYYPTVNVSTDNSRVATININSGIYLASEAVMGDEIWSKSTLLRAKDGSQTVTLTVDENGVMSIPDMEIVYDVLLSDFTTHQITVLSTLTSVTATKPGSAVEPEEPEYFGVEKITPAEGVVTELRIINVVPTVGSLAAMPTGWTITDANNHNYEVTIDWGMSQWYDVMVILNEPITAAGTYTLTIPEGSAQDDFGKIIAAAKYSWTIEAPVYTASVTMNPATLVATDATAWATVENNVATFTAEVYNDKYEFVGWTNGTETVSNDLVYTVTLTKNLELVANFQEKATEPEAPAYDWAGEYTVNATVADETDNWTTPSPLTMKIFYDEAAAAYKLESFAGADIKAASGAYGYYPTVSVSADNSRVATININSGIYLASEAVMGDEIWSKSTLLRAKDGSQTVTLTVDENGVMSIPDMEIVYDVLLSDFTTHQITVLSTLTGVTATKPGSVVEPEPEPEGLADGVYNIHWEWNERGYLAYHPDYPNEAKLAGVTLSGYQSSHYALDAEGVDINWYLITAKDGNRYLFHVATGKFLNYSNEAADEAKANMLSSQEALAITISESTADPASHTITAIVDGSMKFLSSGCGQPTAQHPVRWYYDGNAETDGGTPLKFKKVDGVVVSDEVMAAVEAVINNEGTTGINGVDAENGEQAIYDITGRKIEEITAPGIYIVNGRKVLVK